MSSAKYASIRIKILAKAKSNGTKLRPVSIVYFMKVMDLGSNFYSSSVVDLLTGAISCTAAHIYGLVLTQIYCAAPLSVLNSF